MNHTAYYHSPEAPASAPGRWSGTGRGPQDFGEADFLDWLRGRLVCVMGDAVYEPWIQRLARMAHVREQHERALRAGYVVDPRPAIVVREVHATWCPHCRGNS
jgi:hypothetical protein